MLDHGARNILVLSRSGAREIQGINLLLHHAKTCNANIQALKCDVADAAELRTAFADNGIEISSIQGCIHGGMVLCVRSTRQNELTTY